MPGETYRAYLLRVWQPTRGRRVRASIQDVKTGETHAFGDLDRLFRWLDRESRVDDLNSTPPSERSERRQ